MSETHTPESEPSSPAASSPREKRPRSIGISWKRLLQIRRRIREDCKDMPQQRHPDAVQPTTPAQREAQQRAWEALSPEEREEQQRQKDESYLAGMRLEFPHLGPDATLQELEAEGLRRERLRAEAALESLKLWDLKLKASS